MMSLSNLRTGLNVSGYIGVSFVGDCRAKEGRGHVYMVRMGIAKDGMIAAMFSNSTDNTENLWCSFDLVHGWQRVRQSWNGEKIPYLGRGLAKFRFVFH
jgi:hypothetical protein